MTISRIKAGLARACLLANLGLAASSSATAQTDEGAPPMHAIRIILGDEVITATLNDNPASRDLLAQLPLSLNLDDYSATEKIAYLPRKLSTSGAPDGIDPEVGDITYYAPWGNLAIFYRDFGYSRGLVRLGSVTSGLEHLGYSGSKQATIELAP